MCAGRAQCAVWFVLDAVMCLPPSPPTCPEVKGFRGCLHGDGESQGEKILLGILFILNLGSINQVLGEKGITLTINSTDITWNNSQTLPGQWERALSPLCQDPRDGENSEEGSLADRKSFFFFFPYELKQLSEEAGKERDVEE